MPTPLPDSWPAPTPSQVLPAVYVTLPSLGTMAVGSWSLERELQGALMPGNVRAASGISIGSGNVTVAGLNPDGSAWLPWSRTAPVPTGGDAEWFASYADPDALDKVPLGDWQMAPSSGSLASPTALTFSLVEKQFAGTSAANMVSASLYYFSEPIYLVDQLSRQLGYYSTPKPTESCILSVPLAGGIWVEVGAASFVEPAASTDIFSWSSSNGRVALSGGLSMSADCASSLLNATNEAYITLDTTDEVDFILGDAAYDDVTMIPTVGINPSNGTILARAIGSASVVTGPFVAGADPDSPRRVQLHVQRLGSLGAWTGVRVRARSAYSASWSSWVTSDAASSVATGTAITVVSDADSLVSAIMVNSADDATVWDLGNASLEPLGGKIISPWLSGSLDAWTALQQIVAAWAGAAWATTDGRLVVRNRESMAGIGVPVSGLDVGVNVEDIPWSIDPADVADRLEITYQAVDQASTIESPSTLGPIVWTSDSAIALPPNQTTVVVADVDSFFSPWADTFTDGSSSWTPAWSTSGSFISVYGANSSRSGGMSHATDTALQFKTVQASTGRVEIHITNTTSQTLYTVDANGDPCLFLSAAVAFRQSTSSLIERGTSSDQATNPLTIDLGRYVQSDADAQSIADYIWGRVSTPAWKASSVRVALDWSYDIGDVLQLTHARSGLNVRAIITKVAYDGAPGQVTQTLDLVLLPPTWADFDSAWSGKAWTDFDSAWSGKAWTDFDDDPTRTAA